MEKKGEKWKSKCTRWMSAYRHTTLDLFNIHKTTTHKTSHISQLRRSLSGLFFRVHARPQSTVHNLTKNKQIKNRNLIYISWEKKRFFCFTIWFWVIVNSKIYIYIYKYVKHRDKLDKGHIYKHDWSSLIYRKCLNFLFKGDTGFSRYCCCCCSCSSSVTTAVVSSIPDTCKSSS